MDKNEINDQNIAFWDELCGTHIAGQLGITDTSSESLLKFDTWFFNFYPYLTDVLEPLDGIEDSVLEIGLGYGSVCSYLLSRGVRYRGLDIATGPVQMANHRAQLLNINEEIASAGNALDLSELSNGSFGAVVAIGSLHHTGDFRSSIQEAARIVKPGGIVIGMVYSVFSWRNWKTFPLLLGRLCFSNLSSEGITIRADEKMRWMSDHNSEGNAAPATQYFSRRALRKILSEIGTPSIRSRNLDLPSFRGHTSHRFRRLLMASPIGNLLGLDLYFFIRRTE